MKRTTLTILFVLLLFMLVNAQNRATLALEEGWKFCKGEVTGESDSSFDDSRWQEVTVPHDWAISGPFDLNQDMQNVKVIEDGDKAAKLRTGRTGALPATGIGWYRKSIFLPVCDINKRVYIQFDGAMSNARAYLNGDFIGEWPYGYASFSFDLTDHFKFGEKNVLAVRLENKPEMSRFYTGAGLYRRVLLVSVDQIHVAHWGTTVTTPEVSEKRGIVKIKTKVENYTQIPDKIKLITEIYNKEGNLVSTATSMHQATNKMTFEQNCTIKNPALWGIEYPNLYKVISKVYQGKKMVDSYESSFGFRTIVFDKNKGFFLNGKQLKIKGVCLHHDLGPLGAAVNLRATERQIEIMKEMGCNAIRTSHNPSSVELLDLCDRMGMMVQVEAFDEWKSGKCANGYNTLFDKWAEKDLKALIQRDRNHPCIIMWSVGNEIREQGMSDGGKVARFLSDIAHNEDPTRPTTAGFNNHSGAIDNGLADAVDLVGFNYKHYDYKNQHEKHPNYILYGSETSSAVSSRGVYKFPFRDNWTPWYDDYQVSSYDMDYVPWGSAPDTEFEKQEENEFLLGEFVWTGFDYLGEPTPYGEGSSSRSSYFGIVDLAGLKKDRFYLYQSQWSSKPVLHLMPHWTWPDRLHQLVPVQCYTNYPKAELFVNGVSMGVKVKDKTNKFNRFRLIWDNITYEPGEIKVVAMNVEGVAQEERIIKTAGAPFQIRLIPDRQLIRADGKDLSFITIEILDKEGNLCPRSTSLVFVKINGSAKLKAMCNGDATDQIPFTSNYMPVFNGKMIAIVESTKMTGEITIQVSSERLESGIVRLNSK